MDVIATDFKATWKKTRYVFQDINQNLMFKEQWRRQIG